jgi:tetratricopeptide (TPR) repeat protein
MLIKVDRQAKNWAELKINLPQQSKEFIKAYSEDKLKGEIDPGLCDTLEQTSNGNPFYLDQLLEFLLESQSIKKENGVWVSLTDEVAAVRTLSDLLTARLDRLSHWTKEIIKTAAVIGIEFDYALLRYVMLRSYPDPQIRKSGFIRKRIQEAERSQIWSTKEGDTYIFRHSLLKDTVYAMQLPSRIRKLHKVIAEGILELKSQEIKSHYTELVYHYEKAGNRSLTEKYTLKAFKSFESNYQNNQALIYADKLLELIDEKSRPDDYIRTLMSRAKVLEALGKWPKGIKSYKEAYTLSKRIKSTKFQARTLNEMGHLNILMGNYVQAETMLNKALQLFEQEDDNIGKARAYGNLGNVCLRTSAYTRAREYFEECLALGVTFKSYSYDAQIASRLGLTYMNLGQLSEGIDIMKKQLEICKDHEIKRGSALLSTNLGVVCFEQGLLKEAESYHDMGLIMSRDLGDKLLTSINTGCLGRIYMRQDRYNDAYRSLRQDLILSEELGDKQGLAIANGLFAEYYCDLGDIKNAEMHLELGQKLSEEIDYKKGISKSITTSAKLAFLQSKYKEAIELYRSSIEIAAEMKNLLEEGIGLFGICRCYIKLDKLDSCKDALARLQKVSGLLNNQELTFFTRTLEIRLNPTQSSAEQEQAYLSLLAEADGDKQRVALLYYMVMSGHLDYLNEAISSARKHYESSKFYLSLKRLKELEPLLQEINDPT